MAAKKKTRQSVRKKKKPVPLLKTSVHQANIYLVLIFALGIASIIVASAYDRLNIPGLTQTESASATNSHEDARFAEINTERAKRGISKASYNSELFGHCAKPWSNKMASSGTLAHNPDYSQCYYDGDQSTLSQYAGEAVGGYTATSEPVVTSWMDSCAHRSILLDPDYNIMGVGVTRDDKDVLWTTADLARNSTSNFNYPKMLSNCGIESSVSSGKSFSAINSSGEAGRWYSNASSSSVTAARSTHSIKGSYSFKIFDNSDKANGSLAQLLWATAGREYSASALYYHNSDSISDAGAPSIQLQWLNSKYGLISSKAVSFSSSESTSWRRQTVTGTAPSGTAHVRVLIYSSNADKGGYYFDNIYFERSG